MVFCETLLLSSSLTTSYRQLKNLNLTIYTHNPRGEFENKTAVRKESERMLFKSDFPGYEQNRKPLECVSSRRLLVSGGMYAAGSAGGVCCLTVSCYLAQVIVIVAFWLVREVVYCIFVSSTYTRMTNHHIFFRSIWLLRFHSV